MKHFYFFLAFFLTTTLTSIAQGQAPPIQWIKSYGAETKFIEKTSDGGYVVAGSSSSAQNAGRADFWVARLSGVGSVIWQKTFGGRGDDVANSVQQTTDGGYIIAGSTSSTNGDVTGYHYGTELGYNTPDFWVVKITADGSLEWQKSLGGSRKDIAHSVQQTADGGYIIAGETNSSDGDVTGFHVNNTNTHPDSNDFWVVKLSSNGNIEWKKAFGTIYNEIANSIKQTNDGGYVVAGFTESYDREDVHGSHTKTDGSLNGDYWVLKLDANGNIQWQKCLGGYMSDIGYSVTQTSDGGYAVVGHVLSTEGDVTGHVSGFLNVWVARLNSSGTMLWQKCYGGNAFDYAYEIQQTSDNGFVIVGSTHSTSRDVVGNHGSSDIWVLKLDADGLLQWQKPIGGSGTDGGLSVKQAVDGGYILSGYSGSGDGDFSSVGGGSVVVKLGPITCTPSINIAASSSSVCQGTSVTFNSSITDGGTKPSYQWKINGVNTGTNSSTYTSTTLSNNDIVTCEFTSNAACATATTATSNSIKMTVNPSPVVTISGDKCVRSILTVNSNVAPDSLVWYLNATTAVSKQKAGFDVNAVTIAGGNGPGSNANQLNKPTRFFVDASGNMYIPDMNNARIQKWGPGATAGVTVAGGNGIGSASNQFDRPTSVAMDSKGNMYVTDQQNDRVLKFLPGATAGIRFGGYFYTPTDIYIDANDNVYVSEQNNSLVTKLSPDGSKRVTVAAGNGYGSGAMQLSSPTGIFVDPGGIVYVCDTDNDRVQKWGPGATSGITVAGGNGHGSAANQLANPLGVFVDTYGNIYVADYNNARVQKWAPGASQGITVAGGNGAGIGANQLDHPETIWINEDGALYVADLGNHRIQKFPNALSRTYTTLTEGDYTATVTSSNGCAVTSAPIKVVASKEAEVTITSNGTALCAGVPLTFTASAINGGSEPAYQWKINGTNAGTNGNNKQFSPANLKEGDIISCVMTSNADYCITPKTATSNSITIIKASPGVASVTIPATDTTVCKGSTVTLTAIAVNGGANPKYEWKVNGVNALASTNSSSFTIDNVKDGDVISCKLISSAGLCPDALTAISNSITIHVPETSITSISIAANSAVICTGSTANFTAKPVNGGSNAKYQWKVNGINSGSNSPYYSTNSLKNGDEVICELTSSISCATPNPVASNSIKIAVDNMPVVSIRSDTTIFIGSSIRLNTVTTGNVSRYQWSPSATLDNSTVASPMATPTAKTTYSLRATTPGNCNVTGQVTITTITEVIIPNVFSPNNDGINDVWNIPGLSSYAESSVQVFNRSGQLVFQSKGYNKPWDGTFNGKALPTGTYYYIIATGKEYEKRSGSVTVLR